jgi:hypothetical protein
MYEINDLLFYYIWKTLFVQFLFRQRNKCTKKFYIFSYRTDLPPNRLAEMKIAALDDRASWSKNLLDGADGRFLKEIVPYLSVHVH